jgi:hypothetical protein
MPPKDKARFKAVIDSVAQEKQDESTGNRSVSVEDDAAMKLLIAKVT